MLILLTDGEVRGEAVKIDAALVLLRQDAGIASMAATMPVRMSPLPPLAMPGFPVVLMAVEPSDDDQCAPAFEHGVT